MYFCNTNLKLEMFKSNKENLNKLKTNINSPDRLNRIVEGTVIEGQINSESNIRIDGFLKEPLTQKEGLF